MTRLERGCYFDLLMYQVSNICFTRDEAMMILGDDFEKCWPKIAGKFLEVDGKFHNKKMREVIQDRLKYIDSRRSNRLSKPKKHKTKMSKTYDSHMGGGGGNGNGIGNGEEVKKESVLLYPFDTDTFKKAWAGWNEYRKVELGKKWKSPKTEQIALNKFGREAGDEQTAIAMIEQSIGNQWTGLFELKQKHNGKQSPADRAEAIRREYRKATGQPV